MLCSCTSNLFIVKKNITQAKCNENSEIRDININEIYWFQSVKSIQYKPSHLIISDDNEAVNIYIFPDWPRRTGVSSKILKSESSGIYGYPFTEKDLNYIAKTFNLKMPITFGNYYAIRNSYDITYLTLTKTNNKNYMVIFSIYPPYEGIVVHNIAEVSINKKVLEKYFTEN